MERKKLFEQFSPLDSNKFICYKFADSVLLQELNLHMDQIPQTARDIILSLPTRVKTDKVEADVDMTFHFDFSGETGGQFTAVLKDKQCTVQEGLIGEATCVISAKASDYEDIELGRANPQMAFMMGKIKASNVMAMMQFIGYFRRLVKND